MKAPSQNQKDDGGKSKSFFGTIAGVLAALGGITVLFLSFGYITIAFFLASMKLYGLASFPIQFYREALISLLSNIVEFFYQKDLYTKHLYMVLFTILILLIPVMHSKQIILKSRETTRRININKILSVLFILFLIPVLLVTWKPEWFTFSTGSSIRSTELIFYTICIPVLASLFIYLSINFKENIERFGFAKLYKTTYGILALSFIFLFISIPVGYGSAIYDINLYEVEDIESDSVSSLRDRVKDGFDLLYLMGHTSDREIFTYPTDTPPSLILVDRKLIKSITVRHNNNPAMSMRKLFGVHNMPDQRLLPTKQLSASEQNQWLEGGE